MSRVACPRLLWQKNLAKTVLYERSLPISLDRSGLRWLEALRGRFPLALEASGEVLLERTPGGS
jgi:hypothetical protein